MEEQPDSLQTGRRSRAADPCVGAFQDLPLHTGFKHDHPIIVQGKQRVKATWRKWGDDAIMAKPMLPLAHIEFTWAGLSLLQRQAGLFPEADYRLAALAAVLPDLIDKPLAMFVLTNSNAALLFGHTALLHGGLWLAAAATGTLHRGLPYLLAFSGHLVADRMWSFSQTLLWPLRGRSFHQWKHVGSPKAILAAYLKVIAEEPLLPIFEAFGAVLLVWFVVDRQLYQGKQFSDFIRKGVVGDRSQVAGCK